MIISTSHKTPVFTTSLYTLDIYILVVKTKKATNTKEPVCYKYRKTGYLRIDYTIRD